VYKVRQIYTEIVQFAQSFYESFNFTAQFIQLKNISVMAETTIYKLTAPDGRISFIPAKARAFYESQNLKLADRDRVKIEESTEEEAAEHDEKKIWKDDSIYDKATKLAKEAEDLAAEKEVLASEKEALASENEDLKAQLAALQEAAKKGNKKGDQ
jgi:hypothetical protein